MINMKILQVFMNFDFPHFFIGKSHFSQFVFSAIVRRMFFDICRKLMVKILIGMFRQIAFVEGLMFCICDAGAPFCIV